MLVNKNMLLKFITKIYLGKTSNKINSIRVKVTSNQTFIGSISRSLGIMGEITCNQPLFPIPEGKTEHTIGIGVLSDFIDSVKIMEDEFNIEYGTSNTLILSDSHFKIEYKLGDLAVIPEHKGMKKIPNYHLNLELSKEVLLDIKKAYSVSDDTLLTFTLDKKLNPQFTFGHAGTNYNKIHVQIKNVDSEFLPETYKPIAFKTEALMDAFNLNSDSSKSLMKLSFDGILNLVFTSETFEAVYYQYGNEN